MGYAGYVPAKYASKLTPEQQALKAVSNEATYELMAKLVRNVVVNPSEEKFRRLRLSNPKIAAAITKVPGAVEALTALGWSLDPTDADFLVFPAKKSASMADVRLIEEAHVQHRKDVKDAKRSAAGRERAEAAGGDAARIAAALAADRAERAAAAPVERGSTAQALPNGGIRTAGEVGLNSGGCCG